MKVVRLKYAHNDPLFHRARVAAIPASNLASAQLLLTGEACCGFVPVTLAARHGLPVVPRLAVYSDGPVISSRLFKGGGAGYAAVEDTTVSALALKAAMTTALKLYTYPPSEKTQEKPPFSSVKFYYAPPCGCCEKYLAKLRQYFAVEVTVLDPQKLQELKKELGVPERLWSCHTIAVEGGLFIEGHGQRPSMRNGSRPSHGQVENPLQRQALLLLLTHGYGGDRYHDRKSQYRFRQAGAIDGPIRGGADQ